MNDTEKYYPAVDSNPDFPALEKQVLENWKAAGTFSASVTGRPLEKQGENNEFVFYDGPPFANGLPHYGHLLTGFVKDLFARYQTMRGKRVERRFGWDCHGLPAEMGAEKDLGISGRQAIMHYGMDKFNDYCRTSVMKYTHEWEYYVTRQARWVDFENSYKTMDKSYMESVIWAFSQLYKKGLAYEAFRVMPYSWAAETPLSNFETRLDNSYRDRVDKAVTVAFELNERPQGAPEAEKYYILAWTTTPWTLPSNLALAVGKEVEYKCFVFDNVCYIASSNFILKLAADKNWILGNPWIINLHSEITEGFIKGDTINNFAHVSDIPKISFKSLISLTYKPLFPYFANHPNSFRILDGSDFVNDGDGTGVVHLAPGFGEDDQRVCEEKGIELVCPVDHAGRFTDAIFDFYYDSGHPPLTPPAGVEGTSGQEANIFSLKGKNVLEENLEKYKFGEVNELIIEYLKKHNQLIKQEQITHSYPHCWRTDKPLIYKAVPSWYIEVTKFKDKMVELNQQINWIPDNVKDGIFGKWLENARDWSISRNRFWGTPIPIWKSASGKIEVFGSIAELEAVSGKTIADLHRPFIDEVTFTKDGEEYRRVEDVFDCWFESGSMPYAQAHYPFENKEWFEQHFPADFIVEYVAQTRGWFYTLMVLSTALFEKPPFLNCICHGVVLDDKKQKLSKRLNNYADPKELFDTYGADALRWFMMASPVMRGQELYIDKEGKFIRDVVRLAIKPVWNAYNFFCLYANADGVKAEFEISSHDIMDKYILAKCKQAVEAVKIALDAYDTPAATEAISQFFEVLNNWYIRRNKERFWKSEYDADKQSAYNTLYSVLHIMCRVAAPLLSLTMEKIYQGLTREKSVHLTDFPDVAVIVHDENLMQHMDITRDICNAIHSVRNNAKIRIRQPLAELKIVGHKFKDFNYDLIAKLDMILQEETNVKKVTQERVNLNKYANLVLKINFPILGKRLPDKVKQIIPASKKGEWKQLEDGRIEIAGEILNADECQLLLEPKPEYKERAQALSTNDALVILDTTITPELESEGYARDLVRLIQQARKEANLDVTDRIGLRLRLSEKLTPVLEAHRAYIAQQVLAESITLSDMMGCRFITNDLIEAEAVSIGIL